MKERAEELLIERAVRPLDDGELAELDHLGAAGDTSFDIAAASVASASPPLEQMPQQFSPPPVHDELAARRAQPKRAPAWPWMAAAAAVVLVASGAVWLVIGQEQPLAPSEARTALLGKPDVAKLAWTATADPNAHGASGDVVWSTAEQRGYMRFVGLVPNDPKQFQYQLWIFDKDRDDKYPVDGGVFDVSSNGEVIVPISAKLRVSDATLFAVTIEKPGGVVVSKRERIVVTATRS